MPFFRNTKREPFPFDTSDGNARSVGGRANFEVDLITSTLPAFRHALNTKRIVPVKVDPVTEPEIAKEVAPPAPPALPPAPPTPVPAPPVSEPAMDSPGPTAELSTDDSETVTPDDAQDPPDADTEEDNDDSSGDPELPREGVTKPKKRKFRR